MGRGKAPEGTKVLYWGPEKNQSKNYEYELKEGKGSTYLPNMVRKNVFAHKDSISQMCIGICDW